MIRKLIPKREESLFSDLNDHEKNKLIKESRVLLSKGSFLTMFAYLLFYIIIYSFTGMKNDYPLLMQWLTSVLVSLVCLRLIFAYLVFSDKDKRNIFWYSHNTIVIVLGAYWSFLYLISIINYGLVWTPFVVLVVITGISASALSSLKNDFTMCIAFLTVLLFPMIIMPFFYKTNWTTALGLLYGMYFLYNFFMAKRNYREYWSRVIQNVLLITRSKERDEYQKQVFQATKLASIGELAAGVAHEINNPLMIMTGNLEILEECFDEEEPDVKLYTEAFKKLYISLARVSEIVEGLRTYARSDTNQYQDLDINKAIVETISMINSIYSADGIQIELDLEDGALLVNGTLGRFQQVLMNLISNARDALLALKGVSEALQIKVKTITSDRTIQIKVIDNGYGIKESDLDKIFDSFYTTKDIGKGTGLGLSISYSIIKSMKGKLDVSSEEGKGAVFTITLPKVLN